VAIVAWISPIHEEPYVFLLNQHWKNGDFPDLKSCGEIQYLPDFFEGDDGYFFVVPDQEKDAIVLGVML